MFVFYKKQAQYTLNDKHKNTVRKGQKFLAVFFGARMSQGTFLFVHFYEKTSQLSVILYSVLV